MIAATIGILARLGLSRRLSEKMAPWALGALLLLLAALCVAIWDHYDDEAAIERDRLKGNVEQLEDQLKADGAAADQRLQDAAAQRDQEDAYHDAIANPQAGDAGDPDVRLACEQLRRAGKDTSGLPACGGR